MWSQCKMYESVPVSVTAWHFSCAIPIHYILRLHQFHDVKENNLHINTFPRYQMGYRMLSHKYLKGINCEMNCETLSLKGFGNSPEVVYLNLIFHSIWMCFLPHYKIKNNKGHLNCTQMCIMSY